MSFQAGALLSFFFNDTATTEIYTLSLHDALPISLRPEITPPATTISPDVGRSSPARSRSSVLLPDPDLPVTAVIRPAANVAERPSRTVRSRRPVPYRFTTPRSSAATPAGPPGAAGSTGATPGSTR